MNHLTRNDYAGALRLLAQLEAESGNVDWFARAVVAAVGDFVASQATILSVRDLVTGHRRVLEMPGLGVDPSAMACFDRRFFVHALPLFMDGRTLASIVLLRRGLDFSERDRQRLELLRPHLAFLYRQACRAGEGGPEPPAAPSIAAQQRPVPVVLTQREGEVMHWLSYGKTDAEIAALLAISPRTVHKHLEHIYVKLGVETRTAAVMRTRAMEAPAAEREPRAISRRRPGKGTSAPGILPCRDGSLRGPGQTA